MENLPFAIWLLLYPFISDIRDYFVSKQRRKEGKEPFSHQTEIMYFLFRTGAYLSVAYLLYVR
jgi:hypothetical protein